ncbi:MAG TPA: hypothetical protein VK468_03355 [Pyrinomonadaceae bacterium]|nr:hypothetical protein [Pyrinomonadaceae bacterium]
MPNVIARIVGSNSHIDYIGRVIDALDVESPPSPEDFGFAQFVRIGSAVGVIYDSKLVNPEYASFGPRLSPRPALGAFSPDYINEQGILIGILLLGTLDGDGHAKHGVPRHIIPPGSEITAIDNAVLAAFHAAADGSVQLHYYSQVIAHAGVFAAPLLQTIIEALCVDCSETDRQRLNVLKQSLMWQMTMGGMKL